jgi:hypothetical protein
MRWAVVLGAMVDKSLCCCKRQSLELPTKDDGAANATTVVSPVLGKPESSLAGNLSDRW